MLKRAKFVMRLLTVWLVLCVGLAGFTLTGRAAPQELAAPWTPPQPGYKVVVEQDGIYQMTYDYLDTAELPVDTLDPRTFQLFNMGSEVAIYVEGEDDGSFDPGDPGDYILFYGQKMDTKYTTANVYWLTYGQTYDVSRMDEKDGTLSGTPADPDYFEATVSLEEDNGYWSNMPGGDEQDRWWWRVVGVPGQPPPFEPSLPNVASGTYSATLRVQLYGAILVDEIAYPAAGQADLYVNDNFVDAASWDATAGGQLFEADFDSSYLAPVSNDIKVDCPAPGEYIFIDWLAVDYRHTYTAEGEGNFLCFFGSDQAGTWDYHVGGFGTADIEVFDITEPAAPTRIVSTTVESGLSHTLKFKDTVATREYCALTTDQRLIPPPLKLDTPSDLQGTSNGVDYIVITHAEFADEAQLLADHRATQGPSTLVVDVQDVYDEFSYGIFDSRAIRDFLAHAYEPGRDIWQYVLLVGDGHFDYKDNMSSGMSNYIPPYMAAVDPRIIEAPTDNRYVCISGGDILPDMYIGRLPANSSAEAQAMVNKILNYEQSPASGDWNSKVLFVADDQPDPKGAGNFWDLSDDIANNYLPSAYTADKVYYDPPTPGDPDEPRPQPPYYSDASDARAAIVDAINDGHLLVNYIGHGENIGWDHALLDISSTASLTYTQELPMMLPMTCQEGYFVLPMPAFPSLGASLVRAEGKGAIASWSPAGSGTATCHDYLNEGFFTAVFTDGVREIGPATTLAKQHLDNSTSGCRDVIDTYVLFGDPFMKLNLPPCDVADFNNDGQIRVDDIMQAAARWGAQWGDANYDRKYDLTDDGEITVPDIMEVAALWRETCAAP